MTVELELSAQQAWPALDRQMVEGWVCRCAAGYTQRANSCLPLASPGDAHGVRIPAVEAYYASKNLPPVFKLPDTPDWNALDQALDERGYTVATPSRVLSKAVGSGASNPAFRWAEAFDEAWWTGYSTASGLAEAHGPTARYLTQRVSRPVVARVSDQGRDAAWGFASLVNDRAWVFDVVVDPAHRRRGLGRILMQGLEAAVAGRGISTLHLQVLAANPAANSLYEGLGFTEAYRYHYRRKA